MFPKIDKLRTFRFRLVAWFVGVTTLLVILMMVGIVSALNLTKEQEPPPVIVDRQAWEERLAEQRAEYMHDLKLYFTVGSAWVLLIGSAGMYVLSKELLKPIDDVTYLASRISHTNLKERINYRGPNDEIKRMADTFDSMLGRIEESFEQQQEFIQNASHELRTPIAIALTNIEVQEMDETPTVEEYRELTQTIKASLERMNAVNNNLLLLSEGNNPKMSFAPVDINTILNELIRETTNTASKSNITITPELSDKPIIVNGDIMMLRQCFFNLIENAIKYNKENGTVTVRSFNDAMNASVIVSDTGIGIPKDALPNIFRRFYRVDKSRSRQKGGSGLGLAIVEKIVSLHGGTIHVESELDKGSSFTVILPIDTVSKN
ncbi:MAG: HAMP domain-containing histidine kinase [Dehalococcoidales bacterium]|nr:HAMP domain-containing histidine kinase [Dehalococcoidales bacterium]